MSDEGHHACPGRHHQAGTIIPCGEVLSRERVGSHHSLLAEAPVARIPLLRLPQNVVAREVESTLTSACETNRPSSHSYSDPGHRTQVIACAEPNIQCLHPYEAPITPMQCPTGSTGLTLINHHRKFTTSLHSAAVWVWVGPTCPVGTSNPVTRCESRSLPWPGPPGRTPRGARSSALRWRARRRCSDTRAAPRTAG